MTTAANIDLAFLARELELPVDQVQRTLQLLEDGNTIPFITRYRKDRTGGLNEEQILEIQQEAAKLRLLAERKQTILRSIESQGRLTPELSAKITAARTLKWLEDIYLPYKPKKQTLATIARHRGLEPLAKEIMEANPAAHDLQARGAAFLSPENGLNSVDEVLQGVGHILAETFSERADVRGRLRKALRRDGVLTCVRIDPAERPSTPTAQTSATSGDEASRATAASAPASSTGPAIEVSVRERRRAAGDSAAPGAKVQLTLDLHCDPCETAPETSAPVAANDEVLSNEANEPNPETEVAPSAVLATTALTTGDAETPVTKTVTPPAAAEDSAHVCTSEPARAAAAQTVAGKPEQAKPEQAKPEQAKPKPAIPVTARLAAHKGPTKKQLAKERKKRLLEHAFKDYYNFREALSRLPPHRILAINRGERAKVLRVRFEYQADELIDEATRHMVPDDHPHVDFLRNCARDALQRLVMPSLERELRRELAEEAEQHALQVFIRNLRKLLLQPPVRGKRVLAVDPGFRSGCKLAAIDAFGNVLEQGMVNLVGSEEQRSHARATLATMIQRNALELVAIGNGAGCRAAEHIVSDVIASELAGTPIAYLIVNEAGASVYSTSQVGRDELPHCDPMMRSAVSIGRRLQDPLSELVKINPANIGVGMYQHDMKAKHLRESLDSVVNLCVNFVGVELNSASPSLLGYVSGLNQLTARRVYEYRQQHGPFRNREQLKNVPGIGEATFIQAAGFLRISDGDNPLDATWIHPESYEAARRVIDKLNIPLSDLSPHSASESRPAAAPTASAATVDAPAEAKLELEPVSATQPALATGPVLPTQPAAAVNLASSDTDATLPSPDTNSPAAAETLATHPAACETERVGATGEPTTVTQTEPDPSASESAAGTAASTAIEAAPTATDETPSTATESPPPTVSLTERLANVPVAELSRELAIGELLLNDILAALAKPGRDPRDDFSPPPFRTGIMKLEDLKPGMELQGTVLNVVDFGAFVDIGISDSALIHISKLADQFIRDPQEVVSVGDFLKVWVIDVDKERRRVSLTAIDPTAARRPRERREGKSRRHKPHSQSGTASQVQVGTQGTQGTQRPPRPAAQRPAAQRTPTQRTPIQRTPTQRTPTQRTPTQRPAQGQSMQRPGGKKPFVKPAYKSSAPPPKPKPVRPITNAMLTGKQPMRSFSDLVQFYAKKQQDADENK